MYAMRSSCEGRVGGKWREDREVESNKRIVAEAVMIYLGGRSARIFKRGIAV